MNDATDPTAQTAHGRILVVDTDYQTLGPLTEVLRDRGHQVVVATDGRTGLQRAVEVAADVVLVDEDMPALDVRTFLEVLRDNPRTSAAYAFVMGGGEQARVAATDPRARPLTKPFNAEEVATRVEDVISARYAPRTEPELEGDLSQVTLFDLLQVFGANMRTGRLRVEGKTMDGEVWVQQGRVVAASCGHATGEKALYRMLSLRDGRFVFVPNVETSEEQIAAPIDQLLMEAVRQSDEIARLHDELPDVAAQLTAHSRPASPSGLAAYLFDRLQEPHTIEELLDVSSANDLEILEAIHELISESALHISEPAKHRVRFCEEEELAALRAAALRLRRPGVEGPVRLGVLASSESEMRRFARALGHVQEFLPAREPPAALGGGMVGPLGAIRLDGTDLELFALPLQPSLRPLWGPVLGPITIVLALQEAADANELVQALDVELVDAPPGWEEPEGAVAAVRTALSRKRASSVPV